MPEQGEMEESETMELKAVVAEAQPDVILPERTTAELVACLLLCTLLVYTPSALPR
jgi:hypothetical protein